jgi:competence protein ComEA
MIERPLAAGQRGVILLVGLGLVVTGIVLFLPSPSPAPSTVAPITLAGARVVVPTFLLEPPRIDLNTAGAEELATLPGIGPVLAARIVAYRDAHGPFRSLGELDDVAGIGRALVDGLRGAVLPAD